MNVSGFVQTTRDALQVIFEKRKREKKTSQNNNNINDKKILETEQRQGASQAQDKQIWQG